MPKVPKMSKIDVFYLILNWLCGIQLINCHSGESRNPVIP